MMEGQVAETLSLGHNDAIMDGDGFVEGGGHFFGSEDGFF